MESDRKGMSCRRSLGGVKISQRKPLFTNQTASGDGIGRKQTKLCLPWNPPVPGESLTNCFEKRSAMRTITENNRFLLKQRLEEKRHIREE